MNPHLMRIPLKIALLLALSLALTACFTITTSLKPNGQNELNETDILKVMVAASLPLNVLHQASGLIDSPDPTPGSGNGRPSEICAIIGGDSWSMLDYMYHASAKALSDKLDKNCSLVATSFSTPNDMATSINLPITIPGTKAEQWSHRANYMNIVKALKKHDSINRLILYMGGNDYVIKFNQYRGNFAALDRKIFTDITTAIEGIKAEVEGNAREIEILLIGYTKLNLKDSLEIRNGELRFEGNSYPYGNGIRKEDQKDFNLRIKALSAMLENYAATHERVYFSNSYDLVAPAGDDSAMPPEKMGNLKQKTLFGEDWAHIDAIHLGYNAQHAIAQKAIQLLP